MGAIMMPVNAWGDGRCPRIPTSTCYPDSSEPAWSAGPLVPQGDGRHGLEAGVQSVWKNNYYFFQEGQKLIARKIVNSEKLFLIPKNTKQFFFQERGKLIPNNCFD